MHLPFLQIFFSSWNDFFIKPWEVLVFQQWKKKKNVDLNKRSFHLCITKGSLCPVGGHAVLTFTHATQMQVSAPGLWIWWLCCLRCDFQQLGHKGKFGIPADIFRLIQTQETDSWTGASVHFLHPLKPQSHAPILWVFGLFRSVVGHGGAAASWGPCGHLEGRH